MPQTNWKNHYGETHVCVACGLNCHVDLDKPDVHIPSEDCDGTHDGRERILNKLKQNQPSA